MSISESGEDFTSRGVQEEYWCAVKHALHLEGHLEENIANASRSDPAKVPHLAEMLDDVRDIRQEIALMVIGNGPGGAPPGPGGPPGKVPCPRCAADLQRGNPGPGIPPPGMEETNGFYAERLEDPADFDKRSFRVICPECPDDNCNRCKEAGIDKSAAHHVTVACPAGSYDPSTERCMVGTRAQSVKHPKGEF